MRTSRALLLAVATTLAGCTSERPLALAGSGIAPTPTTTARDAAASPSEAPRSRHALGAERFRQLMEDLSEPDVEFFSDNVVSNETSYLQVASKLRGRVPTGGAYLGVGPEQNFSYIALTRPDRAYIVDIRRDNLVLMLFYKAAFDLASSRAHFIALITGRSFDASEPDDESLDVAGVVARAERTPPGEEGLAAAHGAIFDRIVHGYGIELDERDRRTLERTHRAFAKRGLDIRFELKDESFRKYPTLRELLAAADPSDGVAKGFVASDASFRLLQTMHRENRIVPLVGDFAGGRAMPRLAAHLQGERLTVRSFYVSNVEQYLLVDGKWHAWRKNVAALPVDDDSVFIRCYLDQGRPHPAQLAGHRTTTTLHRIAEFNRHEGVYASMLALATDRTL